jgi:hypothetical protein
MNKNYRLIQYIILCVGKSAMSENRKTQQTSSRDTVKGALTLTVSKRQHWMYKNKDMNHKIYICGRLPYFTLQEHKQIGHVNFRFPPCIIIISHFY